MSNDKPQILIYLNKLALLVFITVLCSCENSSTEKKAHSQPKQLDSAKEPSPPSEQPVNNKKDLQKTRTLSSLDEPCFGVTANDVLAKTHSEYKTTLSLKSSGQTPLTIRMKYNDGQIYCFPPKKAPPGSRVPDQGAYLEIEVEMYFFTTDIIFNEKYQTNIRGEKNTTISFSHRIKPEQIQGSYIPEIDGYEVTEVGIHGMFEDGKCWGSITAYGQRSGMAPVTVIVGNWNNRN